MDWPRPPLRGENTTGATCLGQDHHLTPLLVQGFTPVVVDPGPEKVICSKIWNLRCYDMFVKLCVYVYIYIYILIYNYVYLYIYIYIIYIYICNIYDYICLLFCWYVCFLLGRCFRKPPLGPILSSASPQGSRGTPVFVVACDLAFRASFGRSHGGPPSHHRFP